MSKLKEKASEYYEKGKEQLDKIPPNPATKTIIGTGKKVWAGMKKNPADTLLAVGTAFIVFDIDRIADAVDSTDI